MNGCHEYVGVMAARDEGFAELTVAARDEGDVAEAGGFVQLAVAARGKRGVGEGRRGTTDGGWPGSDGGADEGFAQLTLAARGTDGGVGEESHN